MTEQTDLLLEAQVFEVIGHVGRVGILRFPVLHVLDAMGKRALAGGLDVFLDRVGGIPFGRCSGRLFLGRGPGHRRLLFFGGRRIRHGPILLNLNRERLKDTKMLT